MFLEIYRELNKMHDKIETGDKVQKDTERTRWAWISKYNPWFESSDLFSLLVFFGIPSCGNGTQCFSSPAKSSESIPGLLGANGAGKTTLMRMICGVLKATSSNIHLNGKTLQELGERYYAHLGYMT